VQQIAKSSGRVICPENGPERSIGGLEATRKLTGKGFIFSRWPKIVVVKTLSISPPDSQIATLVNHNQKRRVTCFYAMSEVIWYGFGGLYRCRY
jgi:hypothetical protein